MSSNTPMLTQSEEARAPWNEERDALFEYEVTITETITRKFKVEASNSYEAKEQVNDDVFKLDDLLIELEDFVKTKLEAYKGYTKEEKYLKRILESIEDYEIDPVEISCKWRMVILLVDG